ncbi:hypothetical protein ACFOSV_11275 [Algoriphagus namhaensis]|uniref:Uncharacterized protein n=1 Tax=Algoriphagus namhaensis TaxID=915353 RepID=A0ABV8AT38_9BACT
MPVDLVLDLKFLYSPEVLYNSLSQMGEQGRDNYFKGILFLDMPYLLVYGILFCKILKNLWSGTHLYYLTLGIASVDFVENVFMMYHIRSFPAVSRELAFMTSGLTSMKWLLVMILFTLIITGLLRKIFWVAEKKEQVH